MMVFIMIVRLNLLDSNNAPKISGCYVDTYKRYFCRVCYRDFLLTQPYFVFVLCLKRLSYEIDFKNIDEN
jgi:hypothetical protein